MTIIPSDYTHMETRTLAEALSWETQAKATIERLTKQRDSANDYMAKIVDASITVLNERDRLRAAQEVLTAGGVLANSKTRIIKLYFETDEQYLAAERALGMADDPDLHTHYDCSVNP